VAFRAFLDSLSSGKNCDLKFMYYKIKALPRCTWFKLRLIITISRSAGWLLRAVGRYLWDTRTVEFDLSRALFLD